MSAADFARCSQYRMGFIDLTPELILDLLRLPPNGAIIDGSLIRYIRDAIPSDAKALRVGVTDDGNVRLLMESETFELTPEGVRMRQLVPVIDTKRIEP